MKVFGGALIALCLVGTWFLAERSSDRAVQFEFLSYLDKNKTVALFAVTNRTAMTLEVGWFATKAVTNNTPPEDLISDEDWRRFRIYQYFSPDEGGTVALGTPASSHYVASIFCEEYVSGGIRKKIRRILKRIGIQVPFEEPERFELYSEVLSR